MIELIDELLKECEDKMQRATEALKRELATIRTGRASPGILDRVMVDYMSTPTPLNQLASISVPEARLIVIQPWERSILPQVEKAILKSDLGLNPTNDGRVIRLVIPQLSEERRRDLVKVARKKVEEGRVAVRNCRRDALEHLKRKEKEKAISEDEQTIAHERLQKLTDRHIQEIDRFGEQKEKEILEV